MARNRGRRSRSKRLSWWRHQIHDPYEPQYWTAVTVSVMAPTMDRPYASVLISMANAIADVFMRVRSIEEAQRVVWIEPEALERLEKALVKANEMADKIEADWRVIMDRRRIPADKLHIVEEVERMLRADGR